MSKTAYHFFYPNGDEILAGKCYQDRMEEFLNYYNQQALVMNEGDKEKIKDTFPTKNAYDKEGVALANLSTLTIEKVFTQYLSLSEYTLEEILNILSWKFGKIDLEQSTNDKIIPKDDNWITTVNAINYVNVSNDECTNLIKGCFVEIGERGYKCNVSNLYSLFIHIIENQSDYKNEEDIFKILGIDSNSKRTIRNDSLLSHANNVTGMGLTYILTLIYFITKGRFPIYDQFAWKGIEAIKNISNTVEFNKKKNDGIKYEYPPDKTNKKAVIDFISVKYHEYHCDLNALFQYDKMFDDKDYLRKVDCAIWVYGHLFKGNGKSELNNS